MTYPLIEIKTVPIEIQLKTTRATLEYTGGTAEMEVTRENGGELSIKSRPVRLQVDSFEASNSIRPTTARSIEQAASAGKQAAYQATATYAQRGNLFLNGKIDAVTEISKQATDAGEPFLSEMEFIPSSEPEIDWEEGDIEIRYEMDKLNFDWKVESGEFKFTPGDIEISVKQHPDVIIKYIGGPLYVPPSADPDYVPVDVIA